MVKVEVKRKQHIIMEVTVRDHAGSADQGQDLVCAGVSSITVGMMNALDSLAEDACVFQMKEAYINIQVKKEKSGVSLLLEALLIQLRTLQTSYQSYITINDQEV